MFGAFKGNSITKLKLGLKLSAMTSISKWTTLGFYSIGLAFKATTSQLLIYLTALLFFFLTALLFSIIILFSTSSFLTVLLFSQIEDYSYFDCIIIFPLLFFDIIFPLLFLFSTSSLIILFLTALLFSHYYFCSLLLLFLTALLFFQREDYSFFDCIIIFHYYF
jgi:hypothetical protein